MEATPKFIIHNNNITITFQAMAQLAMARFQPASWRQLEHFGKIGITGKCRLYFNKASLIDFNNS